MATKIIEYGDTQTSRDERVWRDLDVSSETNGCLATLQDTNMSDNKYKDMVVGAPKGSKDIIIIHWLEWLVVGAPKGSKDIIIIDFSSSSESGQE